MLVRGVGAGYSEDFRSLLLGDDDEKIPEESDEQEAFPLGSFNALSIPQRTARERDAEEFQFKMRLLQEQHKKERLVYIQNGFLLLGQRKYENAIVSFKHVLELFPKDEDALKGLCTAYENQGDWYAAQKPPQYLEAIRAYVHAKAKDKIEDVVNELIDEMTAEEAGIKETQKKGTLQDLDAAYKCLVQEEIILGYAERFLQPDFFSERLSKKIKETLEEINHTRKEIRKLSPELDQIGKSFDDLVKSKEDLYRIRDYLKAFLKKNPPTQLKSEADRLLKAINEPLKRYLLADCLQGIDELTDQLKRWSLWKAQDLSKIIETCESWIKQYERVKELSSKDYEKLKPTENIVTQIYYYSDQNQTLLNKVPNFFLETTNQAVKGIRLNAALPLKIVDEFSVFYKNIFQSSVELQTKYINLSDEGRKKLGRRIQSHVQEQLAPRSCWARCFTGRSVKRKLENLKGISEDDLHHWMDEIGPLSMREKEDVLDLFVPKKR